MKKSIFLVSILFLVGCSFQFQPFSRQSEVNRAEVQEGFSKVITSLESLSKLLIEQDKRLKVLEGKKK